MLPSQERDDEGIHQCAWKGRDKFKGDLGGRFGGIINELGIEFQKEGTEDTVSSLCTRD